MIRHFIKASVIAVIGLASATSYAQEFSTNSSKLSFDLLIGMNDPDMDLTIDSGTGDFGGINSFVTGFIPKAKSGINVGLRGNYNVWNNVSAYGQLAYSNNNTDGFGDVQNSIEPLLSLLSLTDLPVDASNIRIDINQDGNYNMLASSIGLRYDYTLKDKLNLGVYAGLGYYNLKTPGMSVDISATVIFLTIPANDIISLDQYSDGSMGWQTGANITYNVTDKFYVGVNAEYNKAEFEYSSMRVTINEENIPSFFADLSPIDLSIIPDIPVASKIDFSSMKYGLILGMRL